MCAHRSCVARLVVAGPNSASVRLDEVIRYMPKLGLATYNVRGIEGIEGLRRLLVAFDAFRPHTDAIKDTEFGILGVQEHNMARGDEAERGKENG